VLAREPAAVHGATRASLLIKKGYIEDDELDRGRRNLLNFGHCFGHAVETASGFAVPHGQAVVVGMILAGAVARARDILSAAEEARLRGTLLLPALRVRPSFDEEGRHRVVAAMRYDKKRVGEGLALVMCGDGLQMRQVTDLTPVEALAALAALPDLYTG